MISSPMDSMSSWMYEKKAPESCGCHMHCQCSGVQTAKGLEIDRPDLEFRCCRAGLVEVHMKRSEVKFRPFDAAVPFKLS